MEEKEKVICLVKSEDDSAILVYDYDRGKLILAEDVCEQSVEKIADIFFTYIVHLSYKFVIDPDLPDYVEEIFQRYSEDFTSELLNDMENEGLLEMYIDENGDFIPTITDFGKEFLGEDND